MADDVETVMSRPGVSVEDRIRFAKERKKKHDHEKGRVGFEGTMKVFTGIDFGEKKERFCYKCGIKNPRNSTTRYDDEGNGKEYCLDCK